MERLKIVLKIMDITAMVISGFNTLQMTPRKDLAYFLLISLSTSCLMTK